MSKRAAKKPSDFDSKSEYRAWLKRSKAARKGWQTRKAVTKKSKKPVKPAKKISFSPTQKTKTKKKNVKAASDKHRFIQEIAKLKAEHAATVKAMQHAHELELFEHRATHSLITNQKSAVRCELRAHPKAVEIWQEIQKVRGMTSDNQFSQFMQQYVGHLERKYGIVTTLRELYTLHLSP